MKNQTTFRGKKGRTVLKMSSAVLGMVFLADPGNAQNVTLNNGGSTAIVNLGGGTGAIGMNRWQVYDAYTMQNQLNQQWFWYSVNGGAVQSIDQIGGLNITADDGSTLTALYRNSMLEVQVSYILQGDGVNPGGGGSATLSESISVFNVSSGNININFYEYANFNLLQNNVNGLNIIGQPGAYSSANQTAVDGAAVAQTVVQPFANYAETGSPTDVLGDVTNGNLLNGTTTFGPGQGDAAWGLEWTSTLAPFAGDSANVLDIFQGDAVSIESVPEPTTFGLITLGALARASSARRKWKRKP